MDSKCVKAQTQCAPADSAAAAARTPPPPLPLPPGVTVQSLPSRLRPTGRLLFTSAPKSAAVNTKTYHQNRFREQTQSRTEELEDLVADPSQQLFTNGPEDLTTSALVTPSNCEEAPTATVPAESNDTSESKNAQLPRPQHVLSKAAKAMSEKDTPVVLATGAETFREAGLTMVLDKNNASVIHHSDKELSKNEDRLKCAVKDVGEAHCESGVAAELSSRHLTNNNSSKDPTNNAYACLCSPRSLPRQNSAQFTSEPVFLPTSELPIALPVKNPPLSELSLLAAPNVKDSVHLWEEHSDEILSHRVTSLLSDFSSFEAECDLLFEICTSSHQGTCETTESDQTINSQTLHLITQTQIDQFGCRTLDVLERIGHVFTAAVAGLQGRGMTILELRSFMAALLTQVQHDLEQRTLSHVKPDSDITENETSAGLLQSILDTLSSPFST